MSTNDTRPNKGTVAENSWKALSPYKWLGRDQNDHHHVLDRKRDVVHRIGLLTGERVRVFDLYDSGITVRGNAVECYVDFVAERVGWADRVLMSRDFLGVRR